MVTSPPTLAELQRWFQAVIAHPGGIETGALARAARSAVPADAVDELILPSRRQSSVERLAVYAQAYWARLVQCLREDFPQVRRAVGDEAFDGLAAGFLLEHPSTSYTLAALGAEFPNYLAATAPPDEGWPRAVAELAALERAVTEVFDLDGGETLGFLSSDDLRDVAPDRLADLRLETLPTVRLLTFDFDVEAWYAALRISPEAPPDVAPRPTYAALSRRDFVVRRHRLSRGRYVLLRSLVAGNTLGEAFATLAADEAAAELDVPDAVRAWFVEWSRAGFFRKLVDAADGR